MTRQPLFIASRAFYWYRTDLLVLEDAEKVPASKPGAVNVVPPVSADTDSKLRLSV